MSLRSLLPLLLACLVAGTAVAATSEKKPADVVFVNGSVYTVDAVRAWATAVAVSGERIVYVGDDRTARAYVGSATRVVDLAGRMLLPGFQDSHVHPGMAPNSETQLNVGGLQTKAEIVDRIRAFAKAHPEKSWIVGTGWHEAAFLPSGQPTREMLDAAVPDRPAFLVNNSQHMAWVNSAALRAAGVTGKTSDPENGRVERDAAGHATGVLQEAAMELVRGVMPALTTAEMADDLAASLREMHRNGITAFADASVRPPVADAYAALAQQGRLQMRARLCQHFDHAQDDDAQLAAMLARRRAFEGTGVAADCVKFVLDGAYGSHTVALLQPYSDEPERFGFGKLFFDPARLERLVVRLDREGFQVHVHALGDGAVRTAFSAFAAARQQNGPRDSRHTLAHLALIDAAELQRFRELGVVANMSPAWNRGDPWETVFGPKMFGPERNVRYRTRSLLDAGAVVAWGSDWPVTGVNPLEGIETAVTRRYPGGKTPAGAQDESWIPAERVTLPEAITAYTAAGAYLLHDEGRRGTIAPGKLADLVVLSRNLFAIDPLAIHAVQVDMTYVGGQPVFERR